MNPSDVLWSLLMGFFVVLFSTRPVACFQVSMTFSPPTLPIGFNGSVNMNLCFKSCSATAAAETGTDGVIVQAFLSSLSAEERREGGECVWCWYLKTPLLALLNWDSFLVKVKASEKGPGKFTPKRGFLPFLNIQSGVSEGDSGKAALPYPIYCIYAVWVPEKCPFSLWFAPYPLPPSNFLLAWLGWHHLPEALLLFNFTWLRDVFQRQSVGMVFLSQVLTDNHSRRISLSKPLNFNLPVTFLELSVLLHNIKQSPGWLTFPLKKP